MTTMSEMTLGDGRQKPAGTWDWYGALDPAHFRLYSVQTFSIGVFQWVDAGRGKTKFLKKAKAVKRFSAPVHAPEEAYEKARQFIARQATA